MLVIMEPQPYNRQDRSRSTASCCKMRSVPRLINPSLLGTPDFAACRWLAPLGFSVSPLPYNSSSPDVRVPTLVEVAKEGHRVGEGPAGGCHPNLSSYASLRAGTRPHWVSRFFEDMMPATAVYAVCLLASPAPLTLQEEINQSRRARLCCR